MSIRMNEPNFYLSESTLISIRQILWHLERKEVERKYETINFELMLILVLGGFLKEEAKIETRKGMFAEDDYLINIISVNPPKVLRIKNIDKEKYSNFALGTLGKEKEQNFKTSELKNNFLILSETNISSALPPRHTLLKGQGGFPEFKDYYILFTRGWNEKLNVENHKESVDADRWLRFTFNIKDIDYKSLKNFFQKYLKNFRENKLLESLNIIEDIFSLFDYEIKYKSKSEIDEKTDKDEFMDKIIETLDMLYDPENVYDKSEFSIDKVKKFLEKIKERMGGHIRIIYNPPSSSEIPDNTKIVLEELKNIGNFEKTRLFESIFYLEMIEGSYEIKKMIYNDAEKRLMIVLEEHKKFVSQILRLIPLVVENITIEGSKTTMLSMIKMIKILVTSIIDYLRKKDNKV